MPLNFTLKMVKMSNFMLCIYYHTYIPKEKKPNQICHGNRVRGTKMLQKLHYFANYILFRTLQNLSLSNIQNISRFEFFFLVTDLLPICYSYNTWTFNLTTAQCPLFILQNGQGPLSKLTLWFMVSMCATCQMLIK